MSPLSELTLLTMRAGVRQVVPRKEGTELPPPTPPHAKGQPVTLSGWVAHSENGLHELRYLLPR